MEQADHHLAKRVTGEGIAENTNELHFFYNVQSQPAFVKHNGAKHPQPQGNIVAIVDAAETRVVE